MEEGVPIPLVLPAFPAKSANLSKVIGPLPDLSEELALRFLQERCDEVTALYEPGAELVICSDGRVFSDLVGVRDDDVTDYRRALVETIERLDLKSLQVFDLDDVRPDTDYHAMRQWLMEQFGEPLKELETRTREHKHHRQIFNGIHRFLMEDLADREPDISRNQARKQSKVLAYEVIRRSNAWSRLVAELFGNALRLSIHPQPPHCDKIGILLGDADDLWLTPWHGVALLQADRFLEDLQRAAAAIDAPFNADVVRKSLHVFDAEFRRCVVQQVSMNVYFGLEDDCRTDDWIRRLTEETGGTPEDSCLYAQMVRSLAVSAGVGTTFRWDDDAMGRWCLYGLNLPCESPSSGLELPPLPERLLRFQQRAATLNPSPQYNVAWSFGKAGFYTKLEKSYAKDADFFLTHEMGGNLTHPAASPADR